MGDSTVEPADNVGAYVKRSCFSEAQAATGGP
jgi:hypothetical protein